MNIAAIIMVIVAYLFGSLSSAILVCRVLGLPDPRTQGSGNPGATNVLRIGGKIAALITLLGDVLKGLLPVLFAKWLAFDATIVALVMFAAFVGHLYPVFFRFEGGKGVATFIGCLLALCWPVALLWLATWLLMAALLRFSSLASLTACVLAPLDLWIVTHSGIYAGTLLLMTLILIYRHRNNIHQLLKGTERKIGKKKNVENK